VTIVTVQFVIHDTHASAFADHMRRAAATFSSSSSTAECASDVRVGIHHAQNPLAADDLASPHGSQLFDRLTGEEVVGRAMCIPAISGFSSARQGSSCIELIGEHVSEVFEASATPERDPGTGMLVYLTVTGRRITEDRVLVQPFSAAAETLARAKGYSVFRSDWLATGGNHGYSWVVNAPGLERLPDDYRSEGEAWAAAADHAIGPADQAVRA